MLSKYALPLFTLLLLAALAFAFLYPLFRDEPASGEAEARTIAVLPFHDLSEEAGHEYFADGIVEMVRNYLSQMGSLRVTSMTSVQRYRDSGHSTAEIGLELGVQYLLEGSVLREGDRVRVIAQLIEVKSDHHLWSSVYDRKFDEVLDLQQELARNITTALQIELTPQMKKKLEIETKSPQAYDLYLRGVDFLTRYTPQDNEQAIALFRRALDHDSAYHAALAGLAQGFVARFSRYGGAASMVDSAIMYGKAAIRLQPDHPEGYFSLGLAYGLIGRKDLQLEELLKTIERDPNHAPAISNLGLNYYNRGQLDEALRWYRKGLQLNPDSYVLRSNIGSALGYLGSFEESEYWFREAVKLKPEVDQAYIGLAHFLLARGDTAAAIEAARPLYDKLEAEPDLAENVGEIYRMAGRGREAAGLFRRHLDGIAHKAADWYSISPIGYAGFLLQNGRQAEADSLLSNALQARLEQYEKGNRDKWICSDLAAIFFLQNRVAEGCLWLKRAVEHGWRDLHFFRRDPYYREVMKEDCVREVLDELSEMISAMNAQMNRVS